MSQNHIPFRDWHTHVTPKTNTILHSSDDGRYQISPISQKENQVHIIGFRVASLVEGGQADLGVFKNLATAKQFVERYDTDEKVNKE